MRKKHRQSLAHFQKQVAVLVAIPNDLTPVLCRMGKDGLIGKLLEWSALMPTGQITETKTNQ